MLDIAEVYRDLNVYFAINDNYTISDKYLKKSFRIIHAERNILQLVHFIEALAIFLVMKPKILLSAGAAPIVIYTILGKLFKIKTIFIESFSRVTKPSVTGRIMYFLADEFYYQWPMLKKYFPRGKFRGNIL